MKRFFMFFLIILFLFISFPIQNPIQMFADTDLQVYKAIQDISVISTESSITVSSSAITSGLSLDENPFQYSIDDSYSEWFNNLSSSMVTVTNPSIVANYAYEISGNGGRKLTRLSNGWFVCATKDNINNKLIYYISTTKGETWSQLCYLNSNATQFSLCSFGTSVYTIANYLGASSEVYFLKFDAITVQNSVPLSWTGSIDVAQSSFSSGVSIIADSNGIIHAAWTSKNSSYPSEPNIRYSKSTDGGLTWNNPTQITNFSGGRYMQSPCIIVNDSTPIIVVSGYNGTTNGVFTYKYTGSWGVYTVYASGISYLQSSPCAVVDSNGVIHAVWEGVDSSTGGYRNIYYSKSTDTGVTWSAKYPITSDNQYDDNRPSVAVDANNNIHVYWDGIESSITTTAYNIRRRVYSGGAWGAISAITSQTSGGALHASLCTNYTGFTEPLMIWQDNQTPSIKFRGVWTNGMVDHSISKSVVNQAYDISGNGGRKLVRLSNGWLICAVAGVSPINSNKSIHLYVSKDNGGSWQRLCWREYDISTGVDIAGRFALVSKGTMVTMIYVAGTGGIYSVTFDATVITNSDLNSYQKTVDSSQTNMGAGCSIAIDSGGYLHATWSSKNAIYPNCFNIRYSKSMDGGATWATPTQITTLTDTNFALMNPCVVIKNDKPIIIMGQSAFAQYGICCTYYNGATWNTNLSGRGVFVYDGGTYSQSNPCAVVDDDGNIHVVWHGIDSTDQIKANIRYSKSSDNGATWSSPLKLTSGNIADQDNPNIAVDKHNKLRVFWEGAINAVPTRYEIRSKKFDGSQWGEIMDITSVSTNNKRFPQLCANYDDFTEPLMIWQDNQTPSIKFRGVWNESSTSGGSLNSYSKDNLLPNTLHTARFTVKFADGTTESAVKNIYTKAVIPSLIQESITGTSIAFLIEDSNSENTQYQISCDDRYVNELGELTTVPTWIKIPDKKIEVMGLIKNSIYNFKITARNHEGVETDYSQPLICTVGLSKPQNIKAQSNSNSITLNWDDVLSATSYDIEVDGVTSTTFSNIEVLNYTHENLSPGTTHVYRVRANNGAAHGDWSEELVVETLNSAPAKVNNLTAQKSSTTVRLQWDEIAGGGVVYQLEADGKFIDTGFENTYLHQNLPVNSRHTYRVRAVNSIGAGPWSNAVIVTTQFTAPMTPTNIKGVGSKVKIVVTWDKVPDTTNYLIEVKCSDPNVKSTVVDNKNSTYGVIYGKPDKTYYLRIKAKNAAGESAWSEQTTVKTYAVETPEFSDVIESQQEVTLKWEAVPDAKTYQIERSGEVVGTTSELQFVDTGLSVETKYSYRIMAISETNQESNWSYSAEAITLPEKPPVPDDFYVIGSNGMVMLSWAAVVGAVAYDLEIDGVIIENGDNTEYTYKDIAPKTEHFYRVRARNTGIEGDWHQGIRLVTLPDTMQPPSAIDVSTTNTVTTIKWEKVPDAVRYEVEVDGSIVYSGTRNEYVHRRLDPNTEHIYRLRSIGYVDISPWSSQIVNNAVTLVSDKGKNAQIGLSASDVTDFSGYTLTVVYNKDVLEVNDLCTLTTSKELTIGKIKGTDVEVIRFEPGKIVFKVDKPIELGKTWSGIINRIGFNGRVTGGTTLTYTVFIAPKLQQ